jgi:TetR/AcrR family transcriptional repressor of uid operon
MPPRASDETPATVASRPGALISLALDPEVATPGDPVSERIIDAALQLVAEGGIRALTMDAVADRARVGRMTVYRRFGDRARLEQALGVRETRRGLAAVAAAQADPSLGAAERIAEGFVAALRVAREHPLFSRISPVDAVIAMNAPGDQSMALVRDFIAAQIRDGQRRGEMRDADPQVAAELLLRIGSSFLLLPQSVIPIGDDAAAREVALNLIAPIVTPR